MAPRRQHLLDLAVLGLLHEAPMHGYELRKRLNLALGPFRALSFGTLYPALRGLVADGLISESNPVSAPNPVSASNPATGHAPATPASRRPRIVYELTDAGRTRFAELNNRADDTAYDDDGFEVRIAFFARTESAVRLRILEGRRARLEDRLTTTSSPSGDRRGGGEAGPGAAAPSPPPPSPLPGRGSPGAGAPASRTGWPPCARPRQPRAPATSGAAP